MPTALLSLDEARRIALAAQGFDRPRPGRVGLRDLRRAVAQIGLLQIDFVNVLAPAHYLVPFSRLGAYDKSLLDDLVYRRREFTEQWAHEASIVPVEIWPLLRHRRETHRVRPWGFERVLERHPGIVAAVQEAVRERGPLAPDDLPDPEGLPGRMADRWGWGLNAKRQVFEAHFGFGRFAVAARRPSFARVYDLAERVIPPEHFRRRVSRDEAQGELVRLAARALGIAALDDLADYYRMPLRDSRGCVADLVRSGELREVRVDGWRAPAYLHRDARPPRRIEAAALLAPFDPLIWYRPRVARLFGFDYRLEIFVPREKRRWGYYVLPFLLGERLAARVDLKADRGARRLLVLSAYREAGTDAAVVARALAAELRAMAAWLDLDGVTAPRRGNLARALASALRI